jgi:diaminopimelate epimerase
MTRVPFRKAHGTGNDFILLPDPDGPFLGAGEVARICHRRFGIGADGVLQVRRTQDCSEVAEQSGQAEWFMDYRNADGTIAEMCGNGARVFAAHLVSSGMSRGPELTIATRGGPRRATVSDHTVSIEMGSARVTPAHVSVAPSDDLATPRSATAVSMPNPHAVTWVDDVAQAGALLEAPITSPVSLFPDGVNVEFVVALNSRHLRMRVFERGVGETLSCGTGACAAAVAFLARNGEVPDGQRIRIDVPGGSLWVTCAPDGEVTLEGPTAFVAEGFITDSGQADG